MSSLPELGNDVISLLALRPSDLSRLRASCQGLRTWLTASDASLIWREATLRCWGVGLDSWALVAAHAPTRVSDFDATTGFGATLGPTDDVTSLELHACRLPYRAAAVVGAVPVSSQGGGTVEWTVRVLDMPRAAGVVLWIGVLFDVRGADECWTVPPAPPPPPSSPPQTPRTPDRGSLGCSKCRMRQAGCSACQAKAVPPSAPSLPAPLAPAHSPAQPPPAMRLVPRRLLRCGCTRTAAGTDGTSCVPHEDGCPAALRGRTMRDALLPFVPNAPLPRAATSSSSAASASTSAGATAAASSAAAAAASSSAATATTPSPSSSSSSSSPPAGGKRAAPPKALIERFHDSPWHVAALGSTGWVWGAAPGGTAAAGLPRFGAGAAVRVRLDRSSGRCSLSFGVDGAPLVVAVKQLCLRGTPQPVLFYPMVHLTDISSPADGDLPLRARVSISRQ